MLLKLQNRPTTSITTTGARKGVNTRDNPQMINVDFAQVINNYQPLADGRLLKTKGYTLHQDFGSERLEEYKDWGDYFTVYSQGSSLKLLDSRDDTTYTIKDDYINTAINGLAYGDYFFAGSPQDQFSRVEQRVNYSSLVGTFNNGDTVKNSSNQIIGDVIDSGSGYVVIGNERSVKLIDGESIEIGSATAVCDTYDFELIGITNAPSPTCMETIGARMYIGAGSTVWFSRVDAGDNPPFENWGSGGTGSPADGEGQISFKRADKVRAIKALGQYIVVYQDDGKFAFEHQTIDSNGTLKRVDISNVSRIDPGGSRAVVNTPSGHYYLNEAGLWNLITLGVKDTPFSEQDIKLSNLLGADFFRDVDFENAQPDIFYDAGTTTIFVTFGKDSQLNNKMLAYNLETQGYSFLDGWAIGKFLLKGQEFYGTSSADGKVFRLFNGYSLNGLPITSVYEQEIQTGDLITRKDLLGLTIQALLDEGTSVNIYFDIYNEDGQLVKNIVQLCVEPHIDLSTIEGWNELGFGGGWGGLDENISLIPTLSDSRVKIRNYQRLILRIEETSKLPHQINYVRVNWKEKSVITKRRVIKKS